MPLAGEARARIDASLEKTRLAVAQKIEKTLSGQGASLGELRAALVETPWADGCARCA